MTDAAIRKLDDAGGQIVVITGASSGIGEATAEAFARQRAGLVLAARDTKALEAVAERCRQIGGSALAVATDVTDAAAVKRLASTTYASIDDYLEDLNDPPLRHQRDLPQEGHGEARPVQHHVRLRWRETTRKNMGLSSS